MNSNKTAFLLIAHGSRLSKANQEVLQLTQKLSKQLGHEVTACFLELAEPSISEAIDRVVREGAKVVKILPYFLTEGRHMQQDIPKIIESKRRQYDGVQFEMLDYVGAHPLLQEALIKILQA